jgi:hypothetical protein
MKNFIAMIKMRFAKACGKCGGSGACNKVSRRWNRMPSVWADRYVL